MEDALVRRKLTTYALLGTAVGDAFGLKAEGLPFAVTSKIKNWEHGLLFSRAILSDDTEQSLLVVRALARSRGEVDIFRKTLRRSLIGWFWALPPGIGFGTARSIVKLTFGGKNGIRTAGNGGAMRSAVIGTHFYDDVDKIREFVEAGTALTHRDQRAVVGALAVAFAAAAHRRGDGWREVIAMVEPDAKSADDYETWSKAMSIFATYLDEQQSVESYAKAIGCETGVSGYVYHTVPVALYAWARNEDPIGSLKSVWRCGGDTDSVGAIAGALIFAHNEVEPSEIWLRRIIDYPITVDVLRGAVERVSYPWIRMFFRNILMFSWILPYAIFVHAPQKFVSMLSRRK